MAKVFRFHQGTDTIEDWQNSTIYGKTAIEGIKDPAGATATKEITSIPSPFARIDLVKTAFENIVNNGKLEGETIFHKMVSDALDVGEIFFNLDKYQDKVSIFVWDKNYDLKSLLESPNPKHRLLGDTLKLYIEQDTKAYNFDKTERLYLLNSKEGADEINIIGGTSPITLFFTTANKLDYVNIRFGNDRAFDSDFQPLYKRDFNYIKFLFGFRKSIAEFSRDFKAFDEYLNLTLQHLTAAQRSEILNYQDFEIDFEKLSAGVAGNTVEILGHPLRKRTEKSANIEENSGFVIQSAKYTGEKKPLVLPVETYSERTKYTTAVWDRDSKVPYEDNRPLSERTLPLVDDKYPYLTIGDFLEPYIIRTIYPIYSDKFFDGNLSVSSGAVSKGYLLPVKKQYFDFFDVKNLLGLTNDGKKILEINQLTSGGVNVTLRIPIKDNKYITYERTYYPPANDYQIAEPETERNRGAVVEQQFGLSVYPFLKLERENNSHYRVALIDQDILAHTKHHSYNLDFYSEKNSHKLTETAVKQRSDKNKGGGATSKYYVLETEFDYIELRTSRAKGLVIPKFQVALQGTSEFTFAIDFGTSNTHIEYSKDGGEPKPFEITENDVQIGSLFNPNDPEVKSMFTLYRAGILLDLLVQEFIPEKINQQVEYQFPQRTVINCLETLDLDKGTYALADFNIPFVYEKNPIDRHLKTETNLKWSDFTTNLNRIKVIDAFFENLLFLIRNKVVLNGGDLSKTKLKWLYPSSMGVGRISMLENKWNELFEKYINKEHNPEKISESIVPFYYYKKKGIMAMTHKVVSIDIGGGTTDVVVYENNRPTVLTSFRFAANAIFGDAYGNSTSINGFVIKYLDRIRTLLETNHQYDLIKVLDSIRDSGKSEDVISFLFSIEKNKNIIEQHIPISFSKELSLNADLKIVFVVFYSAIIYHITKLLKDHDIPSPKYITFSGTGSKVVNIIDNSKKLNILSELTKTIFEKIYGDAVDAIQLIQTEYPKEISAKGALLADSDGIVNVNEIKKVFLGAVNNKSSITYADLSEQVEREVLEEYNSFIEMLFSLNKNLSFRDYFGINLKHLDSYRKYLTENASDYLKRGIQTKKKELNDVLDSELEETLFFYPLVGGLNHLAFKIQTELNQ